MNRQSEWAWVGLCLPDLATFPSTRVTYVEARPWTMAKGPEHSMASWGGRLLLKSAHWARESCLSETRFLGRQREEQRSELGGCQRLVTGLPRKQHHVACQNTSGGRVPLHSQHRALLGQVSPQETLGTVKVTGWVLASAWERFSPTVSVLGDGGLCVKCAWDACLPGAHMARPRKL